MSIYGEQIIDLYRHPLNQGKLSHPTVSFRAFNPLCGDDVTVDILLKKAVVKDIRHRGNGCAISQASISLLTELSKEKNKKEIMGFSTDTVVELLGVSLGPVRLKCALIGLEAIQKALLLYEEKNS